MSNPERGALSMVESMLRTLGFAVSAIGLSVFAVAAASAAEIDADSLAQKFIDGPTQEAREAKAKRKTDRERRLQQVRERELDALSLRLKQARDAHAAGETRSAGNTDPDVPDSVLSPELRSAEKNEPLNLEWLPDRASRTADVVEPASPVEGEREQLDSVDKEPDVQRVAVLLLLKPSRRSSRRFERTADPILCLGRSCYISQGVEGDAKQMIRGRALGPKNSIGQRAGACRGSPRCVFRNIQVSDRQFRIQPIDLGWIRHDRRRPMDAVIDPTCAVVKKRLSCEWAIEGPDYRVWMVPENLAKQVGSHGLKQALDSGLTPVRQHVGVPGAPSGKKS